MDSLIIILIIAYMGYSNWARDRAEEKRLELFNRPCKCGDVDPRVAIEDNAELPEDDGGDEIVELEEVDPEQLIKQL